MDGVLVLDKPSGWTSHDAVNKARRLMGTRRIGHLGTLDPMATGVLPLVVGRATRLAQFYTRNAKSYEAVIRFGHSTHSYDRDGTPTSEPVAPELDAAEIDDLLNRFRGAFDQVPPPVSAKKVGGQPAHKLTRKNVEFTLEPVPVEVYSLELLETRETEIVIRLRCSAGTYVRSIAHELGQLTGFGAYVEQLRRTQSGDFTLDQAVTLPALEALAAEGRQASILVPPAEMLPEMPIERVDALTAGQIRQGRDFRTSPFRAHGPAKYIKAVDEGGDLVAIGEIRLPNVYHPILVL
ncbi:MAG: tRNA pseudouridine(55) synthase TruB [Acidobacteria bacterium]|nr:tRNA pseudouridine(55) synthase TruB [Acidobacteriota bacterium]